MRPESLIYTATQAISSLHLSCGKTKTSWIKFFSSTFHWPKAEHAQLYWKLINNDFVPRFPNSKPCAMDEQALGTSASSANMAFKTPGKSFLRPLNQQHVPSLSPRSDPPSRSLIQAKKYLIKPFVVLVYVHECLGTRKKWAKSILQARSTEISVLRAPSIAWVFRIEWSARRTHNPSVPGSSPALTRYLYLFHGSPEVKSSTTLGNS